MTKHNEILRQLIDQDCTDAFQLKRVLMSGADPNYTIEAEWKEPNEKGEYPLLHRAIVRRNFEAVKAIVEAGADINKPLMVNNNNEEVLEISALDMARKINSSGYHPQAKNILQYIWNIHIAKHQQPQPIAA